MIKLIIFDWDDVITLGAKEGYFACYHSAISAVGVQLSPEEERKRIMAKWGKSFEAETQELLKDNPELVERACAFFKKEFWGDAFVNALKLTPGINETLLRLKEKYVLAVATGNNYKMITERIMPRFNIPPVFAQISASHQVEDQEKTKPHPFMLLEIMRKQMVKPEETVFVGDAKSDMQMAKNASVTPIAVLSGHLTRKDAEDMGVQYIIEDATHLESIIETIS